MNSSFIKMLFIESIKGRFISSEESIFNRMLTIFNEKANVVSQAAFDKFLRILQVEGALVQSDLPRHQL